MRRAHALLVASSGVTAACTLLLPDDVTGGRAEPDASMDATELDSPSAEGGADATGAGDALVPDAGNPCPRRGDVPDLVAYYPLDERSGTTVRDCSGRGHDGQILRVVASTWTDGKFGAGVRVASPDGCIDFGTSPDFEFKGAFTVMAWVNVGSYPSSGTMAILGKSSSTDVAGWRVHTATVAEVGAGVTIGGGQTLYVGRDPVPTSEWHHAAVLFAPTAELALYIDGVRVSAKQWPSALVEDVGAAVRAGCRANNTGFIDGVIDELRLYARALTPTEIAQLSAP